MTLIRWRNSQNFNIKPYNLAHLSRSELFCLISLIFDCAQMRQPLKILINVEAPLHLYSEILPEHDNQSEEKKHGQAEKNHIGPVTRSVVEIESDRRAYNRYEREDYEREHIVLLRLKICEEKHDAHRKSAEANYRNYEESEALNEDNVN